MRGLPEEGELCFLVERLWHAIAVAPESWKPDACGEVAAQFLGPSSVA